MSSSPIQTAPSAMLSGVKSTISGRVSTGMISSERSILNQLFHPQFQRLLTHSQERELSKLEMKSKLIRQVSLSRNTSAGLVICQCSRLNSLSWEIFSLTTSTVLMSDVPLTFLIAFRAGQCAAQKYHPSIVFSLRLPSGSIRYSFNITTRCFSTLEIPTVPYPLKAPADGLKVLTSMFRDLGDHGTPMVKSPATSSTTRAVLTSPLFMELATWLLSGNAKRSQNCSLTGSMENPSTEIRSISISLCFNHLYFSYTH